MSLFGLFTPIFGSISVSGQLRTYPSPNPTVTLTYILTYNKMLRYGRGRCAVAQILILIPIFQLLKMQPLDHTKLSHGTSKSLFQITIFFDTF